MPFHWLYSLVRRGCVSPTSPTPPPARTHQTGARWRPVRRPLRADHWQTIVTLGLPASLWIRSENHTSLYHERMIPEHLRTSPCSFPADLITTELNCTEMWKPSVRRLDVCTVCRTATTNAIMAPKQWCSGFLPGRRKCVNYQPSVAKTKAPNNNKKKPTRATVHLCSLLETCSMSPNVFLHTSKGKRRLFKFVHTIIRFWGPVAVLLVLLFCSDGDFRTLCPYSVSAFNLYLDCDQILSKPKTATALLKVLFHPHPCW